LPDYRIYVLDSTGHLEGPAHEVECPNDMAAIETARRYVDGHDVEVWRGATLVRTLKHDVRGAAWSGPKQRPRER
jgi:hypothetical protein